MNKVSKSRSETRFWYVGIKNGCVFPSHEFNKHLVEHHAYASCTVCARESRYTIASIYSKRSKLFLPARGLSTFCVLVSISSSTCVNSCPSSKQFSLIEATLILADSYMSWLAAFLPAKCCFKTTPMRWAVDTKTISATRGNVARKKE